VEQHSSQEKSRLRRFYSTRRKELDLQWRCRSDREICAAIRALPEYQAAECAAFFIPWGAEPDLRELFFEKRTFLPRFSTELEGYEMVEITNLEKDLLPGKYGIPEPSPELPAAAPELLRKDLLFMVPAVACSAAGVRLGRGGGFYDRLLAGIEKKPVAVIYSCQLAPSLPCACHDLPMGIIVTENKIIHC
jgi:5-formyltetrahydrofolate cyclo-ligase